MTQAKIIGLIAGVVVVGAGIALALRPGTLNYTAPEEVVQEQRQEAPTGKKKAFSEFLKDGGTYQCRVQQYAGDTDTQGTVYLHGGLIRGEYRTQAKGMDIDSTVVVRDGYAYAWSSAVAGTGFKSKINLDAQGNVESEQSAGSYSFNAEQIGDYDCQPWTADSSKFDVPSDITFREL